MKRGKSKLIIANTRQNARRDPGTGKTLIARAVVGEANAMRTGLPLQLALLTACIGAACGASEWRNILLSQPIVLVILRFGGPFEKAIDRHWPRSTKTEADTY